MTDLLRRPETADRSAFHLTSMMPAVLYALVVLALILALRTGDRGVLALSVTVVLAFLALCSHILARSGRDVAFLLILPVVISAWQNVYLLTVTSTAQPDTLHIALAYSPLIVAALLLGMSAQFFKAESTSAPNVLVAGALMFAVATWATLTALFVPTTSTAAAFGSLRNLLTPFLFLIAGLVFSRFTTPARFARALCILAWTVAAFGFWELFAHPFWRESTLTELWGLKGLPVNPQTGMPGNLYGTSFVDGEFGRRMAATFADPVNFGGFLVSALAASWFLRRYVLIAVLLVCIILATSKGALLSLLAFACVWAWNYLARRFFYAISLACMAGGLLFITFTGAGNSASTRAHIAGFTTAFTELPNYPLGHGLGRAGTLATTVGDESDSGVYETGIGLIVAQLGVPGLILFLVFFAWLVRECLNRARDRREATLAQALLAAFLAVGAFNEVALSPNSSAAAFILMGLVLGGSKLSDSPQGRHVRPLRDERPTSSDGPSVV